ERPGPGVPGGGDDERAPGPRVVDGELDVRGPDERLIGPEGEVDYPGAAVRRPADRLRGVERGTLTVRAESPDRDDADLRGARDSLAVVRDRRNDAGHAGPVVDLSRRVDIHRVRVAVDEGL